MALIMSGKTTTSSSNRFCSAWKITYYSYFSIRFWINYSLRPIKFVEHIYPITPHTTPWDCSRNRPILNRLNFRQTIRGLWWTIQIQALLSKKITNLCFDYQSKVWYLTVCFCSSQIIWHYMNLMVSVAVAHTLPFVLLFAFRVIY